MIKNRKNWCKKFLLLGIVLVFALFIASGCDSIKHPSEQLIKSETLVALKSYCAYPLTCEIMTNTVQIDNLDDADFITSKGTFKSANAFNVYQQHTFRIIFLYYYESDELILSSVNIDGTYYYS